MSINFPPHKESVYCKWCEKCKNLDRFRVGYRGFEMSCDKNYSIDEQKIYIGLCDDFDIKLDFNTIEVKLNKDKWDITINPFPNIN
jgi:hypothetical protein